MRQVLQQWVKVQAGDQVELVCPELKAGDIFDVVVSAALDPEPSSAGQPGGERSRPRRSVLDIISEATGHVLFKAGHEVDGHIREERN